jgi:hypothetical protein
MKIIYGTIADTTIAWCLWRSVEAFHNTEDDTGNEGEYLERIISIPTFMPIHCGTQCTCEVNSPSTKPMW